MSNLPKHATRDAARSVREREIIITWEQEMSVHLANGGTPKYVDYQADTPIDMNNVIARMLIDLSIIRN